MKVALADIEDAIRLAVDKHRGQKDKGGQAYVLHPLRVMMKMGTDLERMAAVLHDVVEDTETTLEDLRRLGFPEPVVEALDCLTRREGEPYADFVARAKANPLSRKVKLADLEDNMDLRRIVEPVENDFERLRRYLKSWRELAG